MNNSFLNTAIPTIIRTAIALRQGNGHRPAKIRPLSPNEKGLIEKFFSNKNGMIKNDLCVRFKQHKLPEEISIFQVTGYIVTLHRRVAQGDLQIRDLKAYKEFMGYHRAVWKSYNSPKYWAMRKRFPKIRVTTTLQLAA
jgi:hypothetical protein